MALQSEEKKALVEVYSRPSVGSHKIHESFTPIILLLSLWTLNDQRVPPSAVLEAAYLLPTATFHNYLHLLPDHPA